MVKNIYLAKIYFTDLSEYKIRPVLVIKMLDDDCICLQLTTQLYHKSILFKYLATVSDDKFNKVYSEFCEKLECKGLK